VDVEAKLSADHVTLVIMHKGADAPLPEVTNT
jgi:hypothetical protein